MANFFSSNHLSSNSFSFMSTKETKELSTIKRKSSKQKITEKKNEDGPSSPSLDPISPRSVDGYAKNPNYKKSKSIFRIFEKGPTIDDQSEDWLYHSGPKLPLDCYKTNRFGQRQHRTLM